MALTPSHDILIAGTAAYNFPVTPDAYQSDASASVNGETREGASGFFAKVSQDGTQLLYSSVFGLSGYYLSIDGMQQDPSGNVWIAGQGILPALAYSATVGPFAGTRWQRIPRGVRRADAQPAVLNLCGWHRRHFAGKWAGD
jgi:hypothetical protein